MIATCHSYGGVTASVYVMERGEMIARHQHEFAHTTSVAFGLSEVEIYGDKPSKFQMIRTNVPVELPANIDHEIRALEDGTVIVNMSIGPAYGVPVEDRSPPGQDGGVMFDD